jgi:hypothetical protein
MNDQLQILAVFLILHVQHHAIQCSAIPASFYVGTLLPFLPFYIRSMISYVNSGYHMMINCSWIIPELFHVVF